MNLDAKFSYDLEHSLVPSANAVIGFGADADCCDECHELYRYLGQDKAVQRCECAF